MSPDILLVVAFTAVVQSVFGAGVLLFGTPLLLLLGHDFVEVLVVLLPISITINALQVARHHALVDRDFYRWILLLTLPPIAVFLFLATHTQLNIGIIIGAFLLLIALKEFSPRVAAWIEALMKHEKPYFMTMGVIHGISNLGGSMLTALVHHKQFDKDTARVTIAASYGTFALVQLLTLGLFSSTLIDIPFAENLMYLTVGALIFLLTDEMLYQGINRDRYQRIFAGFLTISGVLLIGKALA